MAALFAPAVAVLALAAQPLLEAWCGNRELARWAAAPAGLLAGGSAINALMTAPYALQLSVRWTKPGLLGAAASLVITALVLAVCAPRFGAVGAALAWPVANLLVLAVVVPVTHRHVLGNAAVGWHRAVGGPILATLLVTVSAGFLLPGSRSSVAGAVTLGTVAVVASAAVAWHQGRRDQRGSVSGTAS
jgi:hypothetical protein